MATNATVMPVTRPVVPYETKESDADAGADFSQLTKAQLFNMAERLGLDVSRTSRKSDLIEILQEAGQ